MSTSKEIEIQYQDSDIVVINKPGGLLSVPGRGPEKQDCVSFRLRQLYRDMIEQSAVHRLDMYTSGLMVYAKTKAAHRTLSIDFEKRRINKRYIATVERKIARESGEIQLAFRLDPDNRPKQIYDPEQGKLGHTLWRKLWDGQSTSRIEFTPTTGRTHQLRLHASHPLGLDAPIVGDSLYGSGNDGDPMHLCASYLGFHHPSSNISIEFSLTPPF